MLLKVTPAAPSLPAIRTLPLGKRAATAYLARDVHGRGAASRGESVGGD